jgi:hypothetical protein
MTALDGDGIAQAHPGAGVYTRAFAAERRRLHSLGQFPSCSWRGAH